MCAVKVREVARDLSLSPATVSKAINGKPGQVSLDTARTVLKHCYKHGYMSKTEADRILYKMSAMNSAKQVFVVTHFHGVLVYDTVFAGICEELQNNDMYPSSFLVHDEGSMLRFPYEKAGCVIIIGRVIPKALDELSNNGVPVVLVDNRIAGSGASAINTNNMDAVSESVQILAGIGHKRIAFLCNHQDKKAFTYTFHQRQIGYMAGMAAAGLPIDKELMIVIEGSDYDNEDFDWEKCRQDLRDLGRKILEVDPLPTAVVAANDMIAYLLREVLQENGIKVPDDITIVGYDGLHRLSIEKTGYQPLSTQVVDWRKLGREAVGLALDLLCDPQQGPKYIEVPTVYEDAGTVAAPRKELITF